MSGQRIAIDEVKVADRVRGLGDVGELMRSIAELGLLNPITVTPDLRLIAGAHRLEACRRLGWRDIPAVVLDLDESGARLAEIDENLIRRELSVLERAEHLAERKRLHEALHPDTRRGVAGGKARHGAATDHLSFAHDAAEKLGESARNVRRYIEIADNLDRGTRDAIRSLPIADNQSELRRLAGVDAEKRSEVVAELAAGAHSVKDAQRAIVARSLRAEAPPMPRGPFRVVVADPPWPYQRESDASHRSANPYPSMTLEAIAALPVAELSHADAVLWLWATNAHLESAHRIAAEWGFTPKTALTWDKKRIGLGDWLRNQTEHCLMAVKGRPVVELRGQSTLLAAARREHSRKPDEFYQLVEELCPGSKLELFARERRPGWQSFGAELERFGDAA